MVTRGEILSINYTGNTCSVRLPYFESAGVNDPIVAEATFSNTPGSFNGYKVGDVVTVAFNDGESDSPVIIGKQYNSLAEEQSTPRGAINCENLTVSSEAAIPLSTRLIQDTSTNVAQVGLTNFNTIGDVVNSITTITKKQDTDFHDLTNIIATAEKLSSELKKQIKVIDSKRTIYEEDHDPQKDAVEFPGYTTFTTTRDYVNYYVEFNGTKVKVDEDNKDSLGIIPGTTIAYTIVKTVLKQGDLWIYTGDTKAEPEGGIAPKNKSDYKENYIKIKDNAPYPYEAGSYFKVADETSLTKLDNAGLLLDTDITSWVTADVAVHTGVKSNKITITPYTKMGSSGEPIKDANSYISYKWGETGNWSNWIKPEEIEVILTAIQNKDLFIRAGYKTTNKKNEEEPTVYNSKIIPYSAENTPVLSLSKDEAEMLYYTYYNSITKKVEAAPQRTIVSTATLYKNGAALTSGVTYAWTGSGGTIEGEGKNSKIIVTGITADTGEATFTCTATLGTENYTKTFKVVKKVSSLVPSYTGMKYKDTMHAWTGTEWKETTSEELTKVVEFSSKMEQTADKIEAKVSKEDDGSAESFGWNLQYDKWIVYSEAGGGSGTGKKKAILVVDKDGLTLDGRIRIGKYIKEVQTRYQISSSQTTAPTESWEQWKEAEVPPTTEKPYEWKWERQIDGLDEVFKEYKTCITGEHGKDATSYWVSVSTPIHTGKTQKEDIVIQAWSKTGTAAEVVDTTAAKFNINGVEKTADKGKYTIKATEVASIYATTDITIIALHGTTEYDKETITYSPVNTPVIDLSSDTASIPYNTKDEKIGTENVKSKATVYINGTPISATYTWAATNCTIKSSLTAQEVEVSKITNGKKFGTATCTATITEEGKYKNNKYSKVFNIVKQIQGEDGQPGQTGTGTKYFGKRDWTSKQIEDYTWIGYSDTWTQTLKPGVETITGDTIWLAITNTTSGATEKLHGNLYIKVIDGTSATVNPAGIVVNCIWGERGDSGLTRYRYKGGTSKDTPPDTEYKDWKNYAPIEPTVATPYIWTVAETITNEVIPGTFGNATLYSTLEGLVSILTTDGIDLVSKTEDPSSPTGYKYHLKADTLTGAVSEEVKIGGWNIGARELYSGTTLDKIGLQTAPTYKTGDPAEIKPIVGDFTVNGITYSPKNSIIFYGKEYIDTGIVVGNNNYTINFEIDNIENDFNCIVAAGTDSDEGDAWALGYQKITYTLTISGETTVYRPRFFLYSYTEDDTVIETSSWNQKHGINIILEDTKCTLAMPGFEEQTIAHTAWGYNQKWRNDSFKIGLDITNSGANLKGNIYNVKIYKDTELVQNLIPVYNNSTYKNGFFDLVTNKFLGSSTGTLGADGSSLEYNTIYAGSKIDTMAPLKITNTGKVIITEGDIGGSISIGDGNFTVDKLGNTAVNSRLDVSSIAISGSNIARGSTKSETSTKYYIKYNFYNQAFSKKIDFWGYVYSDSNFSIPIAAPEDIPVKTKATISAGEMSPLVSIEAEGLIHKGSKSEIFFTDTLPFILTSQTVTLSPEQETYSCYTWENDSLYISNNLSPSTAGTEGGGLSIGTGNYPWWLVYSIYGIANHSQCYDLMVSYNEDSNRGKIQFFPGSSNTLTTTTIAGASFYTTEGCGITPCYFEGRTKIPKEGWYVPDVIYAKTLYSNASKSSNIYGTLQSSSDKNLKHDILYDISKYDNIFDGLQPASFKYNDNTSGRTHLGFIAQDIEKTILDNGLTTQECDLVTINKEEEEDPETKEKKYVDRYYVRYQDLHALEVRQIQLLKQRNTELENKVETLETKLNLLLEKYPIEDKDK